MRLLAPRPQAREVRKEEASCAQGRWQWGTWRTLTGGERCRTTGWETSTQRATSPCKHSHMWAQMKQCPLTTAPKKLRQTCRRTRNEARTWPDVLLRRRHRCWEADTMLAPRSSLPCLCNLSLSLKRKSGEKMQTRYEKRKRARLST